MWAVGCARGCGARSIICDYHRFLKIHGKLQSGGFRWCSSWNVHLNILHLIKLLLCFAYNFCLLRALISS